ncbi:hypothetical protein FA13DRAFT_1743598 [Coprinellus micaceus]|uniref:Uncharacterized protein n=1 Tax=Coprinellus micaceus TaxID=71717 RepID=A0A4Y7SEJ2_COPMI|nr:hypothetical protein FA13DRAFT_1743598 [Coprinellus micaceus]
MRVYPTAQPRPVTARPHMHSYWRPSQFSHSSDPLSDTTEVGIVPPRSRDHNRDWERRMTGISSPSSP